MYVEAIVPSYFKDKVALGDFLYSDLLSFRIPSSGMHSSVPLKVVGFYDTENTNVVIIPKDVVVLHGSDYDVDSLFVIRRELMDIEGFKGFGLNQSDDEQTLKAIKARKKQVLNLMRRLNFLSGVTNKEDEDTNEISRLEEYFDTLIVEVEKRAGEYRDAYNNEDQFNPAQIEKDFREWLNLSSHDFRKWSQARGEGKESSVTIGELKPGERTILEWAMEKFGDKFNLHYLRYSFSVYYGIQSVRWINEDVKPNVPWQTMTEEEVVSTTEKEKSVGGAKVTIKKGVIENRGRWVPYIKKTQELTNAANALDKALGISLTEGMKINETQVRNYIIQANDLANEENKSIDLNSTIQSRLKLIKQELKALDTEMKATKELITENYDPKGPVGYTKETITVDGVPKEVWVFNRDFENQFRQAASGSSERFIQSVLNKYYKNAIIESLLELITAQRNRKIMLSAIMMEAFNAEDENTQDTGLYAEGTIFRYLQDIVLDAKKEVLDSLSEYDRII